MADRLLTRLVARAAPAPPDESVRYRSRFVAALLAAVLLLPYGFYNYYLGYTGRGLAQLGLVFSSFALIILDNPKALFGSSMLGPLGILAMLLLYGVLAWQLVDFFRILTGTLQPNNGEYGHAPAT